MKHKISSSDIYFKHVTIFSFELHDRSFRGSRSRFTIHQTDDKKRFDHILTSSSTQSLDFWLTSKLFQLFAAKMSEDVAMIIVTDDEFDEETVHINTSTERFRNDIELTNLKKADASSRRDFRFQILDIWHSVSFYKVFTCWFARALHFD